MEYINQITRSFAAECTISGVLTESEPRIFPQSVGLKIPNIDSDNIIVDIESQSVTMEWDGITDEKSASSIVTETAKTMSFREFRSFAHDFTFSIISPETDEPFSNHFPRINDGYDNKTPDVIMKSEDVCIVLEFTTTIAKLKQTMLARFEEKKFKYSDAIKRRIHASRPESDDIKYGFFPIVVSGVQVLCAPMIGLTQSTINELCARFRFASAIVQIAREKGANIEDDDITQLKSDILSVIRSIKPRFQSEGDCIVPLTKERVLTEDTSINVLEFAREFYGESLRKAIPTVKRKVTGESLKSLKAKYLSACELPNVNLRHDCKSILQVPNCIPPTGQIWDVKKCYKRGDYPEFIDDCIDKMQDYEWRFELSKEEHIELAMREGTIQDERKIATERRKYKRAKIPLSSGQRVEFGKVGVQGKTMDHDTEVSFYRKDKSRPFHPNIFTDDIDEFISSSSQDGFESMPKNLLTSEILLRQSAGDHGSYDQKRLYEILDTVKTMNLFHWCSFLSDIGTELAISLKQNVSNDEFIIKKLPHWDCFIVIKPTNSSSHIFYCVVSSVHSIPATNDGVSKPMNETETFKYTEWMSYSLSKLTNLIKAESFFLVMLSQWSRYYGVMIQNFRDQPSIMKMVKLCLLIHLEDKSRTEEIFTLFRYISMEKFSITKVDNLKMLEKLPTILWSRLQCWASQKLLQVMCDETYLPVIEEEESEHGVSKKERRWANMINPYTRENLTHPKQLVELYYIGYATNKDAKSWENTEFQLIEKIVKYEMELDKVRSKYCGIEEEPNNDYRFHEWSRKMVCASADAIKRYLKSQYSGGYMGKLTESIVHRLHRLTWEQVATLKASSTFNPAVGKEVDKDGKFTTRRIKVIVAVMREKHMLKDTPVLTLIDILENLNRSGGLRVDIFKKNQHGGLREIYVLDLASRVLQLCLEEISRSICLELPIEMMMHPELKLRKPQEHMYKAAVAQEMFKSNVSSSNDAKVWNQGHHVAKFAQFLCRLLPKEWHGLIVNGLQLWTNKLIALPDGVMSILARVDTPRFYNSIHKAIHDSYKGIRPMRWLRPSETFLRIESGMMQGILHYTSSLFHAGMLILRDGLWKVFSKQLGVKNITTDLVSSDDSSRMTDVFYRDKKDFKRGKIYARADHMLIDDFSRSFGIWMSPKSTYCCNGIMEFNSEYFFRASLYRPTLKWSYACLNIVEVESLVERQEVMYNLITELLEGGAGFRQSYECNVAMGFLHYRLLGVTVNPLAVDYCIRLAEIPDPTLGYFLLDSSLGAGLAGFSYNLWKRVKKYNNISRLYQVLMSQGKMTTTTTGQITRGVQTRFGNRQKVMKIMEECEEAIPAWRTTVEEDPQILYSVPRTLQNSLVKIMVKLTSPSVTRSLAKGNSIARMLASAVYLISGFSTTIGSNWNAIIKEKEDKEVKKTSLWRLLYLDVGGSQPLGEDQERALFPQKDYFINLEQTLVSLEKFNLAPFGSRKMLRSHIQVFPEGASLPFSLEKMVRWKWFSEQLPAAPSILSVVWSAYQSIYPWLKETPQETLDNPVSHFETHIQLRNFIARQETRGRLVHFTGAPIRDSKTRDVLYECLIKNQLLGHTLVDGDTAVKREAPKEVQLYSHIASIVNYPLKPMSKKDLITKALLEAPDLWDGSDLRVSSRRTKLGVIQKYLKLITKSDNKLKQEDRPELLSYIMKSRLGIIGGFKQVQQKRAGVSSRANLWDGDAEWFGFVGNTSVSIRLYDEKLQSITTNSISKLRENESLLSNLLKEFGVQVIDKSRAHTIGVHVFFDLSTFRADKTGCPVYEIPELKYNLGVQKDNFRINISPTHIRLQQSEDRDQKFFTIMSHQIKTSDFVFNAEIEQPLKLLDAWVNNRSEDPEDLSKVLNKVQEGGETKNIDIREYKQFVKDGFLPSLARSGWRFNQAARFVPEPMLASDDGPLVLDTPISLIERSGSFEMEDIDFFSGMEEAVDDYDDVSIDEENEASFDIHDAILGEFDVTPYHGVSGNIRSVHKYWDDLSRDLFLGTSRISREHLEAGFSDPGNSKLAEWLTFYLGWDFTPFKFEPASTKSGLQILDEI
ncbi:RNA-dependent RNA polymerase [Sefomo virus]|nr:RNA-dependent RNA polymerase [Sefomo virus]